MQQDFNRVHWDFVLQGFVLTSALKVLVFYKGGKNKRCLLASVIFWGPGLAFPVSL